MLGKAFDIVVDVGAFAATWLIAVMALTIGLEVLMRRVFNNSLPWVIQINEYAVMAIPFLAGAWLLKRDGHTRLTLVMERVSPRTANLNEGGHVHPRGPRSAPCWFWKTGSRVWEGFDAGDDHPGRRVQHPAGLDLVGAAVRVRNSLHPVPARCIRLVSRSGPCRG